MSKTIQVIINPVSGKPEPVLNAINSVFHPAGVKWPVLITQQAGDAERWAREAAEAGVDIVAAYGGDGTIMEAASGLRGLDTPLAVLPGGTGNLMSTELGIPRDLAEACKIAVDPNSVIRKVDMGQANDRPFLLRVGVGYEAEKLKSATQEMKERFGNFAYAIGSVKALRAGPQSTYRLVLDGQEVWTVGRTCFIANSGNMGFGQVSFAKAINISDGLLDVLVLRDNDLRTLASLAIKVADLNREQYSLQHWQAREIILEADPPQLVQGDGELWGDTPLHVRILPGAVNVLTPASAAS